MKKKNKVILAILFFMLVLQVLPSCLMVGIRDDYFYHSLAEEVSGEYIPYLYIQKKTWHIPFLIFRIDIDKLPHGFVMLQYDQTYLNTDKDFESFVLDDLYIEFSDGSKVTMLKSELPEAKRKFVISDKNNHFEEQLFENVITRRADFTVYTVGRSIKYDGTVVPFNRKTMYKYKKNATFHTIIDEWASC